MTTSGKPRGVKPKEALIKSKRAYQKLSDNGESFARSQAFSKKTQAYAQLYFRKFLARLSLNQRFPNSTNKLFWQKAGAALLILALCVIASRLTGQSVCPIYRTLGIPCPSCGMTRAWVCLLHFDIPGAFQMHPLFWVVPPGLVFCSPPVQQRLPGKAKTVVCVAVGFVFITVWVVRMVLLFPHTPPMVYLPNAWLPRVAQWVWGLARHFALRY